MLPNRIVNSLLANCFAGERHRLVRMANGERLAPFQSGVSLIALLQRGAGPVAPRQKPLNVPLDHYNPAAELVTAQSW